MLWHTAPNGILNYLFDEVATIFYQRYPNSYAKHVVSEDVIERVITEDTIRTKKLIVKEGSSILKRVPRWLSRMTEIRVIPVIEESIYNRRTQTLETVTRNVSHMDLFQMNEFCNYAPSSRSPGSTEVVRSVTINFNAGRMSSVYEKLTLLGFKSSTQKTLKGFNERLEEKYPKSLATVTSDKGEKMRKMKEILHVNLPCENEVGGMSIYSVITLAALASLLHSAYSAAQHRAYLRLTEQPFVSLPIDVVIQTLASLIALIYGATHVAGAFQAIKSDPNRGRSWDETGSCLSFAVFDHRAKAFATSH